MLVAYRGCSIREVPPTIGKGVFDLETNTEKTKVEKIYVVKESFLTYIHSWKEYVEILTTDTLITNLFTDVTVEVGSTGDFKTINGALEYLSAFYPTYKSKGIECKILIQDGEVINEQIFVDKIDLSYITIASANENNVVQVDVTGWTGVTHDTRGNRPFFSAENGGKLPCIQCLFSCITPLEGWTNENQAVGYYCNRGSSGVILGSVNSSEVLANVGFEGFYDNIIANNNSEVVLREAIARNAARYGILSRHISRISARSADITNCGEISVYADRSSMIDVRKADLSNSACGIVAYHVSTIAANGTIINNISGEWAVDCRQGSTVDCESMLMNTIENGFYVLEGGTIIANNASIINLTGNRYNCEINTLTNKGIIYAD